MYLPAESNRTLTGHCNGFRSSPGTGAGDVLRLAEEFGRERLPRVEEDWVRLGTVQP